MSFLIISIMHINVLFFFLKFKMIVLYPNVCPCTCKCKWW